MWQVVHLVYRVARAVLTLLVPSLAWEYELATGFQVKLDPQRELQTQARELEGLKACHAAHVEEQEKETALDNLHSAHCRLRT